MSVIEERNTESIVLCALVFRCERGPGGGLIVTIHIVLLAQLSGGHQEKKDVIKDSLSGTRLLLSPYGVSRDVAASPETEWASPETLRRLPRRCGVSRETLRRLLRRCGVS